MQKNTKKYKKEKKKVQARQPGCVRGMRKQGLVLKPREIALSNAAKKKNGGLSRTSMGTDRARIATNVSSRASQVNYYFGGP